MWIEKLSNGVLCVLTPLGPRYLRVATFSQRVYLLWMFRHFEILPLQVLSSRQKKFVETLCAQQQFVAVSPGEEWETPILGTVERRPPVEVETLPPRRPNARAADAVSPLAADVRQRP